MRTGILTALLITIGVAASASAQSLADVARKEAARRAAITSHGKVYTNESLASAPAPAAPAVPAAPAAAAPKPEASKDASTADASKPDDGKGAADTKPDEASWRKRIADERDALNRSHIFADALQSRINALTTDFTNRDDPVQRQQISDDRQKALAELDRVTKEIEQHTKAIADIQEEARKAGVPPGWVR
jgi:hypothetical protein